MLRKNLILTPRIHKYYKINFSLKKVPNKTKKEQENNIYSGRSF